MLLWKETIFIEITTNYLHKAPFVISRLTHRVWGPNNYLCCYQENHTNENNKQIGCVVFQSTICSRWKWRHPGDRAVESLWGWKGRWLGAFPLSSRFGIDDAKVTLMPVCVDWTWDLMSADRLTGSSFSVFPEIPIFLPDDRCSSLVRSLCCKKHSQLLVNVLYM